MLIKRMQTKRDCFKKYPQNPLQNVNPRFPKTFAPHFPAFSWPLYTSSLREARRKILFSPLQLPLLLRKRQLKSNYTHSYEAAPAIMPKPVFVPFGQLGTSSIKYIKIAMPFVLLLTPTIH